MTDIDLIKREMPKWGTEELRTAVFGLIEQLEAYRSWTARVEQAAAEIDPDVAGDVIGPEGQHEGRYRLARIEDDIQDNLTALEEQLEALRAAATALYERVEMDESVGVCLSSRVESLNLRDVLVSTPEGNLACSSCGAVIAWGGERPNDCLRCGAPFPAKRPS